MYDHVLNSSPEKFTFFEISKMYRIAIKIFEISNEGEGIFL